MSISWLDVKLGIRMLFKNPRLTLVGGFGMAVAIAIGAGSFSGFYLFLYPRLPLDEGHRIVALDNQDVRSGAAERPSVHDFATWKQEMKTVREVSAYRDVQRNLIAADGTAEPLRLVEISASAFRVARVAPRLGRPLLDEDERPGAPPVLVIGHELWRTRFALDPRVVGRTVRLGHTVHTIVGVMPEGFAFPVNHRAWLPLRLTPLDYPRGGGPELMVFGRLADGATQEQAQAELEALGRRAAAELPRAHADVRPQVLPYTYPVAGMQDVSIWEVGLMQALISLLVVVVAVNVAILVYARTAARRGEIAVRAALGASRRRIVGQLFMEALVLGAAASAVGLLLAWIGLTTTIQIATADPAGAPFWRTASIAPATVLYTVGMAVLTAVIAGVLPALGVTGRRMQEGLRQLGGGSGLQLGRTWTVLVVGQVAFAVAAIPVALGLAADEFGDAVNRPQFDVDHYLAVSLSADPEPPSGMNAETYRRETPERFANLQGEFVRRLREEPWVEGAAVATSVPGEGPWERIQLDGRAGNGDETWVVTSHIGPEYLDLYAVPVLAGRGLGPGDADTTTTAIVVNRAFVRRYMGGGNGVGRRVRYEAPEAPGVPPAPERWYEIVGVVGDFHHNRIVPERIRPVLFHPLVPQRFGTLSVSVRLRGGSTGHYQARLRQLAAAVDPALQLGIRPLAEVYADRQTALGLTFAVLVIIILSVLLLCAAGIHALLSFAVSQRRKEIGIRAALGADPRRLLRSIFSRSARQLGIGLALGLAAAGAIDWSMGGDALNGRGPILLPFVCVLMMATGLLATRGPARRGLRIQPTEALREE